MPQDVGPQYTAYEAITVSSSAIGLTTASIAGQNAAHITVETGAVRYRLDGTDPTTTEGHLLNIGDILDLDSSHQLQKIRFIQRDAGISGTLRCSYGR